jgi:hypothetical protein
MAFQIFLFLTSFLIHFSTTTSIQLLKSQFYKSSAESVNGLAVCAADEPTVVTPAIGRSSSQCAADCTENSCCVAFQMNMQLEQCQLYNYLPFHDSSISGCKPFYRKFLLQCNFILLYFTQFHIICTAFLMLTLLCPKGVPGAHMYFAFIDLCGSEVMANASTTF